MLFRPTNLSLVLLALAGPSIAQPTPEQGVYQGQMVVRATITQPRQLMQVAGLTESYWSHRVGLGEVDLQIKAAARDALTQLGIQHRVLIPDLQKLIDEERRQIERAASQEDDAWYATYHNLADINAYGLSLVNAHPTLASRVQAGTSLEGRPIWALKLSGPDAPGNPRASRPQILFNGGQHAREWVTPPTAMQIAERLLADYATDPRVRAVMDRAEIFVVPVLNPDGYEYTWTNQRLWRKNRRNNGDGSFGVDLNRNWSFGWGGNDGSSPNPSNDTYRGPSPFSEPETASLRDFMIAQGRIVGSIDIHSYSQLILSPMGYTTDLPPEAAIFDELNVLLEQAVEAPFGTDYVAGPTATTIYIASGTASDWTYGALDGFGYGVECRDTGDFGFILPADQILPNARENYQMAITFAEFIIAPLRFTFPGGHPATFITGTPITIDVTIADGVQTLDTASPQLFWRSSPLAPYTPTPMSIVTGRTFRATIAGQPCGATFEYYVDAETTTGSTVTSPQAAPATVYAAQIVGAPVASFEDACEVAGAWTVGAAGDDATSGLWSNGVPQATGAQPGEDHSPVGTRCWITDARAGSGIGTYDVDGGTTTLTSPTFSAVATAGDATVSYWRWYSNNQGSRPNTNTMPVSISNNGGASWTTLETVSDNAGAWTFKSFRVADFVTPTATMKLRFVARDATGAIVEAAIDDVRCDIAGCPADPADFNGDGFVDFFDYDDYVRCF